MTRTRRARRADELAASTARGHRIRIGRLVLIGVIQVLALLLLGALLPGLELNGWRAAVATVIVIAVLNALVWPLLTRFALALMVLTAGLFALLMNGVVMVIASEFVDGFEIDSVWTGVIATFGITTITVVASALLAIDDDESYFRNVLRLGADRTGEQPPTDVPGILFLQIDGLSEPVLRQVLAEGHMPTLAGWVRSGSHRIVGWECDLSSQTGASQAGILLGDNHDMPAFRWYEKDQARVMVSNHPKDAAEIEARHSTGNGLLADGGVSRANVFSGDATDTLFTFSTVADRSRRNRTAFRYYFSDPYSMTRLVVLGIAEVAREVRARRWARRNDIQPRLARKGVYPLLRAGTTVVLREFTVCTLISDISRGVPAAYVDFVGYDEVAHHSGISAPDAIADLRRLDDQFARIERVIRDARRPYHVVVLSDHGQTQGATFLQRYGCSLQELVTNLLAGDATVEAPAPVGEGWGNLNGLLTDAIHDDAGVSTKLLRVAVRPRTVDGEVLLGPGYEERVAPPPPETDAIVLASGNLGLISFTRLEGRATIEGIQETYPGLLAGLATHPGIGFVMVRSEEQGAVAIGAGGVRYLADDRVEGADPLAPFGPRTADHLRRTDGFANAPDILVNSFFDPDADEGAAFEELIGFHGGLGGKQTEPFICFPRSFPIDDGEIVGAASIHQLFKGWLAQARDGTLPPPGGPITVEPTPLPDLLAEPAHG
jgi:uncharacterized membrane protein YvlD (DUF360 family)